MGVKWAEPLLLLYTIAYFAVYDIWRRGGCQSSSSSSPYCNSELSGAADFASRGCTDGVGGEEEDAVEEVEGETVEESEAFTRLEEGEGESAAGCGWG